MTPRVVVLTPEELVLLVEGAVTSALKRAATGLEHPKPAPITPLFLHEREVAKRYRIGRRELRTMILDFRLPSTTRRVPGGESYFIRADDADRVLGNSNV